MNYIDKFGIPYHQVTNISFQPGRKMWDVLWNLDPVAHIVLHDNILFGLVRRTKTLKGEENTRLFAENWDAYTTVRDAKTKRKAGLIPSDEEHAEVTAAFATLKKNGPVLS